MRVCEFPERSALLYGLGRFAARASVRYYFIIGLKSSCVAIINFIAALCKLFCQLFFASDLHQYSFQRRPQ